MIDWPGYYSGTSDREPRPLAVRGADLVGTPGRAVDVGSGAGLESAYLLGLGWRVLAVDAQQAAADRLAELAPPGAEDRLEVRIADFGDLTDLPPAELVHSSYSLPFCPPDAFGRLWDAVTGCLVPGGVLAVNLFGDRDTWAQDPDSGLTFHTRADVDRLLAGLDVVELEEEENDLPAYSGPKHWHLFQILARRPA